ncbi:MAG: PLP-dependent aminotransferase family protein [Deltaproteobacteria bacterium]|nr:PLP-dependent aminotransferase family protein [Deltaproteobacteria bacterium]
MLEIGQDGLAPDFLYEQLATELGLAIEQGSLRSGERLPSVRRLAQDRGVSVSTVLQAYMRLESAGLVEVRPKAGHFVRRRTCVVEEPRPPRKALQPARVAVSDGVARLTTALRDPSVVPLGSAYLDASVLPIVALNRTLAQIAREAGTAGARYDVPPGLPTLRHQLARRAVTWGVALHEDDFVTTVGATEGITLGLRAVARPDDTVVVESPCYFGLLQVIESLGMRALEVPASARTGLDLDALDEAIRSTPVRAIVLSANVSNPLGSVMPDAHKERLVATARRHDIPIVEDDVYGDLTFDGPRPRPLRAFDHDGRVLLVGSVSKTLAPGYRVGWIAPGRYQERVERLKLAQSLACPTLPQMAVAELLGSGGYDRHIRRLRGLLAGQVERYREAIAAVFPAGTRLSAPRGGFLLWVELPAGVDALAVQERALGRHVAIAPGPIFSARQRFGNFIRVSCGLPFSPAVDAALRIVADACEPARRPLG